MDWNDPTPEEIKDKVLSGVKSGSILLFHNDLDNTTEALPQILTQLKSEGYEFVTVSELIYWDNYSIDSTGMQIPDLQSSINLTPENVEEVMAQYSDEIAAAGFTEQQIEMAADAIKGGVEIPEEFQEVISQIAEDIGVDYTDIASDASAPDEVTNDIDDVEFEDTEEENGGITIDNNSGITAK